MSSVVCPSIRLGASASRRVWYSRCYAGWLINRTTTCCAAPRTPMYVSVCTVCCVCVCVFFPGIISTISYIIISLCTITTPFHSSTPVYVRQTTTLRPTCLSRFVLYYSVIKYKPTRVVRMVDGARTTPSAGGLASSD